MSTIPKNKLNFATRKKILKIYIDGYWSIEHMYKFLYRLNDIFYYGAAKEGFEKYGGKIIDLDAQKRIHNHQNFLKDKSLDSIRIKSIQYSSPGWIEIAFSAAIVSAVYGLIVHYLPNQKESRENRRMDAEILKLEIENLKSIGYTQDEIKNVLKDKIKDSIGALDFIDKAAKSGLITEIKELDYHIEHDEDPPDIVA